MCFSLASFVVATILGILIALINYLIKMRLVNDVEREEEVDSEHLVTPRVPYRIITIGKREPIFAVVIEGSLLVVLYHKYYYSSK